MIIDDPYKQRSMYEYKKENARLSPIAIACTYTMLEISIRESGREKKKRCLLLVSLGDMTVICRCRFLYRKPFLFSLILFFSQWINKNVAVCVWWSSIFLALYLINEAKTGRSKEQANDMLSIYDTISVLSYTVSVLRQ